MRLFGHKVGASLPAEWYARDTVRVARELLGKLLIVRARPEHPLQDRAAGVMVARIVETEAYHGNDPASHCSRGPTERCRIMFGKPGVAYIYLCYGMHQMLNVVTEREGYPGAVLVRAAEPIAGQEWMRRRRPGLDPREWTNGPGRLCRALGIGAAHLGASLTGPKLFVADDGWRPPEVSVSGRVGIRAGRERPWRFFVRGNAWVSRAPENAGSRPAR